MPLILMRSAAIPLRMSTMPTLIAQLMQMPKSNIVIFQVHITTAGDFLNQPQCNRLVQKVSGQVSYLIQDVAYEESLV